jgi:hypothetical protein
LTPLHSDIKLMRTPSTPQGCFGHININLCKYPPTHRDASATLPADDVVHQVDDRIRAFIRGKVSLSLLVGSLTAFVLWMLNLELWLLFAVRGKQGGRDSAVGPRRGLARK